MIYVFGLILLLLLGRLSYVDWKEYRLPNALTALLIAAGLFQAWVLNAAITANLIGAGLGYAIFVGIETSYKYVSGKDGLGRGDAKLLAGGGAWCGWIGLPYIVLIGSGTGLVFMLFPSIKQRFESGHIPFGPFLSLAIFIVWTSFSVLT